MNIWLYRDSSTDSEVFKAFATLIEHLSRGREGRAWCSWAVQAWEQNRFWIGDARSLKGTKIEAIVDLMADTFVSHFPSPFEKGFENEDTLNTLTVLLDDDTPYEPTESVIQAKRRELLERGLMIGFLHPDSSHRSLSLGPSGTPYRVPRPFLTLRWAVPGDVRFVEINPTLRALLDDWIAKCESRLDLDRK